MREHQTNSSERHYVSPSLYKELLTLMIAWEKDLLSSGPEDSNQIQYLQGKVRASGALLARMYALADNRDELPVKPDTPLTFLRKGDDT